MSVPFNWRQFSDPAPSSSEKTTLRYADDDETENVMYQIDLAGARDDITIESET